MFTIVNESSLLHFCFSSQRFPFQLQPVSAVKQAVQQRFGDRRLVEIFVKGTHRKLAGDQRRVDVMPILYDLQQVMPLSLLERLETEIIKDQQIEFRQAGQLLVITAVASRDPQLLKQAMGAFIFDRLPL